MGPVPIRAGESCVTLPRDVLSLLLDKHSEEQRDNEVAALGQDLACSGKGV